MCHIIRLNFAQALIDFGNPGKAKEILMASLDIQTAMNFDGGGSVQGFLSGGGALVQSGEKYCSFQAQFDRPVPYGLVLE